jgi:hypothetical protein
MDEQNGTGLRPGFIRPDYERELVAATTDEERWLLTRREMQTKLDTEPDLLGRSVESLIRIDFDWMTPRAEFWMNSYPHILQHVEFNADDLRAIAHFLGSPSHGLSSTLGTVKTQGELAKRLLYSLTGKTFEARKRGSKGLPLRPADRPQ